MLFCNEVLVETVDGSPVRYVCEAEYGTEHTHAEKMDYMRPLRNGERVLYDAEYDSYAIVVSAKEGQA